ncbi:GNAT family N-acetyltransferase [Sphingobacterium corticis]|uniref:GNAT family N-acetyltransferase n=1 Tax=Sphingobacterium corticis TaxID=1812823 RepID=A0ABW5NKT8_9SPHI
MQLNLQPILENENLALIPLESNDFSSLYRIASDPNIWTQHPNNDRWKMEKFDIFFSNAIQSGGAFKIMDNLSGKIIGSTRFYNYRESDNSIFIGYTFYAVEYWGTGTNKLVKQMMLDYIFQYVDIVFFHIGVNNTRSQIAISKIYAEKIAEEEVYYAGEASRLNFVYAISRERWMNIRL